MGAVPELTSSKYLRFIPWFASLKYLPTGPHSEIVDVSVFPAMLMQTQPYFATKVTTTYKQKVF